MTSLFRAVLTPPGVRIVVWVLAVGYDNQQDVGQICDGLLFLTMSFRLFQLILAMSLTLSSLGTLYRNNGLSIGSKTFGAWGRRTNTSSARTISGTPNKPFQSFWMSVCLRGIQGSQYGNLKRVTASRYPALVALSVYSLAMANILLKTAC